MDFKRYLLHVSTAMTAIFGGTFLIRYFRDGDILKDQLILGVIGVVLLLISLRLRKKESNKPNSQNKIDSAFLTTRRLESYQTDDTERKKSKNPDK